MGKWTRRLAEGTVLGAFAFLCVGTAAAQAPSINVGSVSGAAGSQVSFPVTLALNGSAAQVAGTQNDIAFDGSTPIAVRSGSYCALTPATTCVTSADCPVYPPPFDHEACVNSQCAVTAQSCSVSTDCPLQREACVPSPTGAPECTVNPAIGKDGFFAFTPNGCTGAACTGISAIIVAVNNLTAIGDNTELYTCKVNIDSSATGDHPLTNGGVVLGDTTGQPIPGATGNSGTISVGASGDADGDGVPDASDNCPYTANADQKDTGGIGSGSAPDGIGDVCQCGDVNGNGVVTLADSTIILRSLLEPPTATQQNPQLCDVGGTSGCTLADATIILRANLSPPTATILQRCAPANPQQ
ncbi:MAG: thrombospondin type 3 repeat-containing protein [Candidatus Binatia bacterium]